MSTAAVASTDAGGTPDRAPKRSRAVHYTDEVIDGRTYHIEVSRVSQDRWRAHVVRTPGVPTAMMPFYGPTADEAARQVSEWLTLAHRTSRAGSNGA